MTKVRVQRWRTAAVATVAAASTLLAGCSAGSGDEARPTEPIASVPGPAIALAEDVPASLAFVDQSVAPSTGRIATGAAPVGVHSAPDRLYTQLGVLRADDSVGLTGNRAGVEDQQWAEIIWKTGIAWIPVTALAS